MVCASESRRTDMIATRANRGVTPSIRVEHCSEYAYEAIRCIDTIYDTLWTMEGLNSLCVVGA